MFLRLRKMFWSVMALVVASGAVIALASENHASMHHDRQAATTTLTATVIASGPVQPGNSVPMTLRLRTREDDRPVVLDDLKEMHTKRIHLLMIDPSLDDYQHEHPVANGTPGEYSFNFAPKSSGTYLFYVDVVPVATGIQEYVRAELEVPGTPAPVKETTNTEATVNGYTFKISFAEASLIAGKPVEMTLDVTGPDGNPFNKLEPLMGAFAHFVAFSEDRQQVAHIHPLGEEPTSNNQRGGPRLNAYLNLVEAGYSRLFAQFQMDGKNIFVPFGLQIANRPRPKSVQDIFADVDQSVYALEQALTTGQLSKVHAIAFEVRDLLNGLPRIPLLVPETSQTLITENLMRIDQLATLLDKFGDAGDAAQTRNVLSKLILEIEAIRKSAGVEETSSKLQDARNAVCPISGKAVGSMVEGSHVDYTNYRVGLCCPACADKFMAQADVKLKEAIAVSAVGQPGR